MRTAQIRDRHRRSLKNSMFALFTATCALTIASCSGASHDPQASSTPSATQPTESADPTETAKKGAVATYQAYWKEVEKLYADRSGKSANLKHYAASAALKNAEGDAKRAHDRGLLLMGQVTVKDPTVTKVVTHGKLDYAVISSCLDISKWKTVKADTKKPVTLPANRLTKYVIQSTVERWPEGWRVTRDKPQDRRC